MILRIAKRFQLAAGMAGLLGACAAPAPPEPAEPGVMLVERTAAAMGTELRLTAYTADESGALAAFGAVFEETDRLEQLMSNWIEGSDVLRLNASAGDHPVPVSSETREVLRTANQVSEWTEGRFDVTFAALYGLWKFDYQNKDNSIPDRGEVLKRLSLINYRELITDDVAGTAFLKRKGMSVNLGGIGKGYAVDRAAGILRQRGFKDFMIQFGGDMYVAGRRADRPWNLGIRDPRGPADRSFATMELSDRTFSTSGDYERFFIKDGRRYHHIIDLSTGEPAQGSRSVTIVADRAILADAVAKGVFIMGARGGMALIERLPGVEGVIVSSENEVLVSSGLQSRLTMLSPPTDAP
jgi:thiamine biosynthesis lipoprotein